MNHILLVTVSIGITDWAIKYYKWAKERLVKLPLHEKYPTKRGIILTVDDNEHCYIDPNTTHNLVLGITGSGKSQTSIFPFIDLISRKPPKSATNNFLQESMIINDPKGELASSMAPLLKERGYDVKILNFQEPNFSDSYNPFKSIRETFMQGDVSETANLIDSFSLILNQYLESKDKFWQITSKYLTSAIVMGLLEDLVPSQEDIVTPYLMSTLLSEFANAEMNGESKLDWYFREREVGSRAKSLASATTSTSDKTKAKILATTLINLSLFRDDGIAKMTSKNTIDFDSIIEKPTAIFLIPGSFIEPGVLISIFIEQSYYALSKKIKKDYKGESPRRINYILEEFAQMPQIPNMDTKLDMSKTLNIRWTFYLQDYSQLNAKYDTDMLKKHCTNIIHLGTLTMSFGEGVVLRDERKPIRANFKPAYTYMKIERKELRELVPKASHATLDLTKYLDYLDGANSLNLYRPTNQKFQPPLF